MNSDDSSTPVGQIEDESDDDVIFGGAGNDWIFGEGGDDTVFGGDSPLSEDALAALLADRLA
ncbi:hypothetical protein LOC72_26270 [Roseiconus lacunae]|nr:hypothetical protein [Roseiconus lacunae]